MIKRVAVLLWPLLLLPLFSGCVANSDVKRLENEINALKSMLTDVSDDAALERGAAERAAQAAGEALSDVINAQATADEALTLAKEAKALALQAQKSAGRVDEKAQRMFLKTVQK